MKAEVEHIDYELLVVRYLLGDTTSDEHKQLLEWIRSDEANMRYFKQMKQLSDTCHKLSEKSAYDTETAYKNFEHSQAPAKPTSKLRVLAYTISSVAAIALVALAIYLAPQEETFTQLAQANDHITTVKLNDGSEVTLNKHAKLAISNRFGTSERAIKLQGEAYFSVKHDAKSPFVITVDNVDVKVLGTRFNVFPDSINHELTVTVESGRVAVMYHARSTVITEGEKAVVTFNNSTLEKAANENDNYMSWKTGELQFNDTPLDQVIESINKQYNVHFELATSDIASYRLNASFDYTEIEKVKQLLTIVLKVDIEEKDGKYILSKRETVK